jgi:hypothetical protein
MDSREGETSYQRKEVELKSQEKNEAKEKEVINANAEQKPTPMLPPVSEVELPQYMADMMGVNKEDKVKQHQFYNDLLKGVQEKPHEEVQPRIKLVDFLKTKPLSFSMVDEPMEAEYWLMDTSRKLKSVGCKDDEKVRYATYLLTGSAATWWEDLKFISHEEGVITWADFKNKFRQEYVVKGNMKRKRSEGSEQNNLLVLKHVREFNRLSHYISKEVNMEAKRQRKFMKGLQAVMKMQLRIVRAKEFQELMDSVTTLEDKDNEEQDGLSIKRVRTAYQQELNLQPQTNPYSQPMNQPGATP